MLFRSPPASSRANTKARAGMTGGRIAEGLGPISAGRKPRQVKARRPIRRRPTSSARNAGPINAQINARIAARSPKAGSSNSSSASLTARRVAMTARAARARRAKTAWPCRPCRALIAPSQCSLP